MFIGIAQTSVVGHLLYSPEKNDVYVSTHVVSYPNYAYDGSYTDQHGFDMITSTNVSTHSIEQCRYLEGTTHVDPDDGLLYKTMSVEGKNYPGQGTLIICYRGHVHSNGKVSMKASRDAYYVRDIKLYYHDNVNKVIPMVGKNMLRLMLMTKCMVSLVYCLALAILDGTQRQQIILVIWQTCTQRYFYYAGGGGL